MAFLWTPAVRNGTSGTMMELPAYQAYGMNNFGQVVGITSNFSAFLWTPTSANATSGSVVQVGAASAARAYAINSSGQIVMGTNTIPPSAYQKLSLWTPVTPNANTGSIVDLERLVLTPQVGINDRGQVVDGPGVWTPLIDNGSTGSWTNLATTGQGINALGDIAAGGGGVDLRDAVLWKSLDSTGSNYAMVNLGRISGGYNRGFAVNDRGDIVGSSVVGGTGGAGSRAFLWTQDQGINDLNALLNESGVNWTLLVAEGINNMGQITGFGTYDADGPGPLPSVDHAFLLTPIPEPGASIILFGFAFVFLGSRRR
jgi:hypothetical protein